MSKLFDTAEACRQIGCDKATISRWARRLGLGQKIGTCWALTAAEIQKIREKAPLRRGNPRGWVLANATIAKRKRKARKAL